MHGRPYFTATVTADGNLLITADNEARAWIKEMQQRDTMTSDDILWEGFEGYWNNGSFAPFDAGEANPFVGMWDGPCIAEQMDIDDHGKQTIEGRWWAFMDYCVIDPMEVLKCKGRVLFHSP